MNDTVPSGEQKMKRGPKPRSKRKRNRPGEQHADEDDSQFQSTVVQLTLGGKSIPGRGAPTYLRIVEPYQYTFASFCKARWMGRTIYEVYSNEFGGYTAEYYHQAIRQGRILVSNERVQPSYVIKGSDILMHKVHRHEPAVAVHTNEAPYVKIAAETDEVLAVDKPGTLPIHPCGGYHQNSLMKLLEREDRYGKLYTIHRLDRLTSGLVVLGKTSAAAKEFATLIKQRKCEKLYLARVSGCFPLNSPQNLPCLGTGDEKPAYGEWPSTQDMRTKNAYGYWITDSQNGPVGDQSIVSFSNRTQDIETCLELKKDVAQVSVQWLKMACPVRVVDAKRGVCQSGKFEDLDEATYEKTVKAAQSSFALIRYDRDSNTSVVLCKPETGRTHQLRLHLQTLGHHIANDPNYGGEMWFQNEDGRQICQEARERMLATSNAPGDSVALVTSDDPATSNEVAELANETRGPTESLQDYIKRTCIWCRRQNDPMQEFLVRSPGIWLHALQYTIQTTDGVTHSFRTAVPSWCLS